VIGSLDSETPPTAAQVQQAKAANVKVWSGYIASTPFTGGSAFNLGRPWSEDEFAIAAGCGEPPIAFYSGWDNPAAVKAKAAAFRVKVRLCLDVEGGIRGYGAWTQPNLDASGGGLYANQATQNVCRAPFRILYGTYFNANGSVNNPNATWRGAPPAEPHGWQWWNSHTEFGAGVDRSWLDDYFSSPQGGLSLADAASLEAQLTDIRKWIGDIYNTGNAIEGALVPGTDPNVKTLRDYVGDVYNTTAAIEAIDKAAAGAGLTDADRLLIANLTAAITKTFKAVP
jgi:hypothetical protein